MDKKLIYLILAIIMAGCVSNSNSITPMATIAPPDIGVPTSENGEVISVIAPDGWNSFKVGESIYLMIQNISDEQLISQYDFGARIYMLQENGWVEVENKVAYPDNEDVVLESNKIFDPLKVHTLFLLPDISSSEDIVTLRIFVEGKVSTNDENNNQQVATYIDLQLNH